MEIVKEMQEKIGKEKTLPDLMKLLSPSQTIAAIGAFTSSKKGDVRGVETSAKKLMATMTKEQRPKLVALLGEGLVKRMESL